MNPTRDKPCCQRGASLLEAVIAIGVLALAVPLVFGVLTEAGKCELAARAETCSTWMVRACIEEIRSSLDGCPQWLPRRSLGLPFPPPGEVWALAFSREGQPVAALSRDRYEQGARDVAGQSVRYIAALDSSMVPAKPGLPPMLQVHVSIEYPAISPRPLRAKLDYYTHLP